MNSVHRSIFYSAIERYAGLGLFFVSTAVLSRLLSPSEFGTYAVVNALTAVITASFQEFGGANYLIQKRELSQGSIRTAFTITLALSAIIGTILYLSAGILSAFFEQDSLTSGIKVTALNFLFMPFAGTISALFRRDMDFGKLAICNLIAGSVGTLVSITLAILHFSYMAPIWGGLATNLTLTLIFMAWYRNFGAFRPSLSEYRDVIRFGLYSSGISVINVFYSLAPQIFLAKVLDFASVGLYSRATNLTQTFDKLVLQVLNPIVMPAIAAQRNAEADLKRVYLDAIQLLSVVQWPFLIFIAVMARPIIFIWLGETWLEIVPLVRVLCVANLAIFAACLSYPVFVAVGSVRDALISSLVSLPPSLLVILCASFFGVHAVAASALLTLPFQTAVAMLFIGRHLSLGFGDIARALLKSMVVTTATVSGVLVCAWLIETGIASSLVGLTLALCAAPLCWWLGLAFTGHPLLRQLQHAAGGLAWIAPRLMPGRPVL